jgi:CheY-like chemotaxis protein
MTATTASNSDGSSFHDAPILVVEDNAINYMVLEQQLLKLGCRVYWAETGEKGLELYTQHTFSCVLMDCMLPGMSGLECTQHIRAYEQEHGQARTPIIALTADIRESNKQACFDVDMDDFMGKPFKFADLNNILNLWINQQNSDKKTV